MYKLILVLILSLNVGFSQGLKPNNMISIFSCYDDTNSVDNLHSFAGLRLHTPFPYLHGMVKLDEGSQNLYLFARDSIRVAGQRIEKAGVKFYRDPETNLYYVGYVMIQTNNPTRRMFNLFEGISETFTNPIVDIEENEGSYVEFKFIGENNVLRICSYRRNDGRTNIKMELMVMRVYNLEDNFR